MTRGSQPSTVAEVVTSSAQLHADRVAVMRPDATLVCTYAQLAKRVDAIASALHSVGVTPGGPVLVGIAAAPEMLIALLGTMGAGACVPVNPAYTNTEVADLADELQPQAAVVLAGEASATEQVANDRGLPIVLIGHDGFVADQPAKAPGGEPPTPDDIALILHTAGTTARPKQVPLSHANLVAASHNVVASLQLTPDDRCLNVMPLFHSHGLLGAAMSTVAAGASIVCANGFDPRRFLGWAEATGANWYTAAATIHHLVLDAPGEWPNLRFMRSASAPLAPQVAAALEARFGAPMIEVYGMTEAYQIAANPLPPGERRLGSVGVPTGTEIAIADGEGHHLPPGVEGEVVVRGPAVFRGYSHPPGANDAAFFGDWFRTGDLGRLSDDGYLSITGRIKEQINRGGEKVSPREVDEAVLAHPDVAEAMAFAIPHPQLGEEIGVAVVARPGTTPDATSIRRFLHGRIAPFKVPHKVVVVDQLPTSGTGKYQRVGFAENHADLLDRSSGRAQLEATDDSTLARLAIIWVELLELDMLPEPGDHFFDLGGTSLLTMELVARIEADLGVDLPVVDVIDVATLGEMANRVEQLMGGDHRTPLLRRYRTGTTGQRVVLIPGQYGMALGLNLIADAIDADVDVYLFDYPGNRPGEQPLRSIEALAARLVEELRREGITERLSMYGNSMGGWVAYEAARTLTDAGEPPDLVGIGDMYSPFFNTKDSPLRPSIGRRVRNRLRRLRSNVSKAASRKHDTAPAAAGRQSAVFTASEIARRNYTPKPYAGDLLIVVASEREPQFGATLGWERHATGNIDTVKVDASHSTMHVTQASVIAEGLSEHLRAASAKDH